MKREFVERKRNNQAQHTGDFEDERSSSKNHFSGVGEKERGFVPGDPLSSLLRTLETPDC